MITNSVMKTSPNNFRFTVVRTLARRDDAYAATRVGHGWAGWARRGSAATGRVSDPSPSRKVRGRRAHRVLPVVGGARAEGARPAGEMGQGGRLRGIVDLRPLPPVERRAGPEPVRVVGDRRAGRGHDAAGDDRGDLPDRADPPRDHRPGRGDQRPAARGPIRPRRRHRRSAERADPRRQLAAGRGTPRDARGSSRGHARAVDR